MQCFPDYNPYFTVGTKIPSVHSITGEYDGERRKALLNSEAKGFAPVTKNPWGKRPCFLNDTLLSNEGTVLPLFPHVKPNS